MPAKPSLPKSKPLSANRYALTAQDKKRFAEEQQLGMLAPDSALLSQIAVAVPEDQLVSDHIQSIIQRLFDVASAQQRGNQQAKKRRTLVGLAAPQIGERVRIIVVDTKIGPGRKAPGKLECFINPEIVWRSRETAEGREGCFSAGPVWGLVRRPVALKLRAMTPAGRATERVFEGFTARIVQHECDHLEGIRFADRITSDHKRHWVHAEEILYYVDHTQHWPRICTRERWEAFKKAGSTTLLS